MVDNELILVEEDSLRQKTAVKLGDVNAKINLFSNGGKGGNGGGNFCFILFKVIWQKLFFITLNNKKAGGDGGKGVKLF